MKNFIKKILKQFNIGISQYDTIENLKHHRSDIEEILSLSNLDLIRLAELRSKSKSQLKQDLFVLSETGFKKNGFFVEFGATNGVDFSNTYLLEKEFAWKGILAEPAKIWHVELEKNRHCSIEKNCVWSDSSSTLDFNEVDETELSTIAKYNNCDWASDRRKNGNNYEVKTISLIDLLVKYNAPKVIDYLSIDTEGSEYEILSNFDFDSYEFRVITCEHNHTRIREKIYNLLTSKGYQRKYIGLSEFDDWYIKSV